MLLDANLESVLSTLRRLEPNLADENAWTRAIKHKKHLDRDAVLGAASRAVRRDLRDRLRREMPSFGCLIATVITAAGLDPA